MILAFWAALLLQPVETSVNPAPPMILKAGTQIHLVTEVAIDSRSVRQGQRFGLVVADDVAEGGRILIPKGSRAVGEIEAVSETGMFGKPGSLQLRPLFIDLGGQRINLEGGTRERGKKQVGGAAVATVLTGGLGLIITGKSAKVPAGSAIDGRVRADATIVSHPR